MSKFPKSTEINGGWSEWSEWSTCSASCGGGNRMRSRACDRPVPAHGGADCANDKSSQSLTEERQQCGESPCTLSKLMYNGFNFFALYVKNPLQITTYSLIH